MGIRCTSGVTDINRTRGSGWKRGPGVTGDGFRVPGRIRGNDREGTWGLPGRGGGRGGDDRGVFRGQRDVRAPTGVEPGAPGGGARGAAGEGRGGWEGS
ncbi:hypothetical protein H6P81_006476 [Aristolochia fimbriata]|uniref:Uncharacterized protein n=1 Tax=Aristolochia fimbriata TaxID=158543 RepID=A0AAV7F1A9_ARIFI|nr:hypothetical protein H6P81_006476 [Aristolochia fimbriata]